MNRIRLTRIILLFITLFPLLLNSCTEKDTVQSDKKETLSVSEKKEDEGILLRIMIFSAYAPEKYVAAFEKSMSDKYGIPVEIKIDFINNHDDYYDPIRSGSTDIVVLSHHIFKDERFNYITKGLLSPINLKNIPNAEHLAPELLNADYHRIGDTLYGIPVANGPYGLAYNTLKFENPPKSWQIFWDPAYRKSYVLSRYEYLYNINITALAMGYAQEEISSYDLLNNPNFKKKLSELTGNAHSFWEGVDTAEALYGHSIATAWGDSFSGLKERGEEWRMGFPEEGCLWWIDDFALTKAVETNPLKKQLAEEWINKALSQEYQLENIARTVGTYPVITNLTALLSEEETDRFFSMETEAFFDSHILQSTITERDRNGLKLLWEEAIKAGREP